MSDSAPVSDSPSKLFSNDKQADTVEYLVEHPLGHPKLPAPGQKFKAWAYGERFAHVIGQGPITTNAELKDWVSQGRLSIVKPAIPTK